MLLLLAFRSQPYDGLDPAFGPFLFDTSAESWLGRAEGEELVWLREYLAHNQMHVSAVTVMERVRGYSLLWRRADEGGRERIEAGRIAYLAESGECGRSMEPPASWQAKLWR